jgi:hypothetical protein
VRLLGPDRALKASPSIEAPLNAARGGDEDPGAPQEGLSRGLVIRLPARFRSTSVDAHLSADTEQAPVPDARLRGQRGVSKAVSYRPPTPTPKRHLLGLHKIGNAIE